MSRGKWRLDSPAASASGSYGTNTKASRRSTRCGRTVPIWAARRIWLDAEQKFKCPCHGSGFYKDGINFEGPAPRPLERYAIRVAEDGQLEVDKSRSSSRNWASGKTRIVT